MTRNKRQRRKTEHRETHDFSNRRLVARPKSTPLTAIEDRRRFHPDGFAAPAQSFKKTRHRITEQTYQRKKSINQKSVLPNFYTPTIEIGKLAFQEPKNILVCVRRKVREEVLHALKKTGKRGQKRKKFNYYSSISCKKRK